MSEMTVLAAESRANLGTGASRALRRKGMIPAIIYGNNKDPISIIVEEKEVTKLYRKHGFTSTVITLDVNGTKHKVLPKTVELHPITDIVRHADFIFLGNEMQKVAVPVVYDGKERSVGVKRGGFFNIIHRKVELMCPANAIPLNITLDVANMIVGATIRSKNIKLPEGCSFVKKQNFVLASITGRASKADAAAEETAAAK